MLALLSTPARFIGEVAGSRRILLELVRSDLRARYLGSGLGILWVFAQPAATIVIYWAVFTVAFGVQPVGGVPFVLWLVAGIIPWFFLAEGIAGATTSVIDHDFLVKKIVFRVHLLPIVRILSALFVHLFFLALGIVLLWVSGFPPGLHALQIPYYLVATAMLILGVSWCTASLVVFLRDIGPAVAVLLQFGFWLTPVLWSTGALPPAYARLTALNPAHYLVQGYRDSLVAGIWFWNRGAAATWFWAATLALFLLGASVFRKLRPHFADVI